MHQPRLVGGPARPASRVYQRGRRMKPISSRARVARSLQRRRGPADFGRQRAGPPGLKQAGGVGTHRISRRTLSGDQAPESLRLQFIATGSTRPALPAVSFTDSSVGFFGPQLSLVTARRIRLGRFPVRSGKVWLHPSMDGSSTRLWSQDQSRTVDQRRVTGRSAASTWSSFEKLLLLRRHCLIASCAAELTPPTLPQWLPRDGARP